MPATPPADFPTELLTREHSAVRTLIRVTARRLLRTAEFRGEDSEDLEQELTLALLAALPGYDPARSSPRTFAARVVSSRACTLIRNAGRQCRNRRRVVRLPSGPDEASDPLDQLPAADARRHRGISTPQPHTRGEWEAALRRLPPFDVALVDELRTESKRAVARRRGWSRHALERRVAGIRRQLRAAGVGPC